MSDLRTGRAGRLAKLGGLAVRLGGTAIGLAGKRITAGRDRALEALHQRTAEELFETMAQMKGLPMKVGQILSFMDGVVPAVYQGIYAQLLSRLQVNANPMAWESMRTVLEQELGRPYTEAFVAFEIEPIAAASIGQVYRAELADGRRVAVKIQYPEIAKAVSADLKNAGSLVRTMQAILPNVDAGVMVEDFLDRIAEECDYRREAANMQTFRERWLDDPRVVIPAVVTELSSERVLVSELQAGQRLDELAASSDFAWRSAVGEILFTFVFRSLLRHGMFNADPHPGNFLFPVDTDSARVVFLDFGCVQYFDDDSRRAMRQVVDAILDGATGEPLWSVLAAALEFPADTSAPLRELIEKYVLYCFEPVLAPQPFRYTREYTTRLSELTIEAKLTVAKNLLRFGWREPKRHGLVMLSRILFGMNSVLATLEAEADWRSLLREA
jgi:predicted unusual protein kinase regulating ubiquinone biosynthesis (AarF/ABC1/UbiB family)